MKEFMKLSPQTDEEKLQQRLEGWDRLNGRKIPLHEESTREIHIEFLARLRYPQGIINHVTMLKDETSEAIVRAIPSQVRVPTIVLQGSEDPIFPPDHGEALAKAIQHSEYFLAEGMGHIPNTHFYDLYINMLKQQSKKQK
jgi:pimeloyl-ACP methyl ester carboxylesterase